MKRILMRAAMSPLESQTPYDVLGKNLIGNNMGNMLFPHSISRTVMTEDTMIDTMSFGKIPSDRKALRETAARINAEYDLLILPFANAFRLSFIPELSKITCIVKRLRIPCVVVGVGMQAKIGKKLNNQELGRTVKKFMKAILDRSAIVGLRGENTAGYLKELGFQEERDFTIIGCPSIFMYGKDLPKPDIKGLSPESTVSFNSKISLPQSFHNFMFRCRKDIKDYYYIPQVIEEIRRMYCGTPFPEKFVKKIPNHFPDNMAHPVYMKDRARSFVNVKTWLEFLSQMDFSYGSRIHGNIAAVLAGTPAYVIVSDQRIMELVEYHNIQHTMVADLTDKTSIFDLYEKADFNQVLNGHEARFMHYLDFLTKNDIETIYDKEGNPGRVYFDEAIAKQEFAPPLHAFSTVDLDEQIRRLDALWRAF